MSGLISTKSIWTLIFYFLVILICVCVFFAATSSTIPYWLWKKGLYAPDDTTIEFNLRKDPDALQLVLGKTEGELRELFGDVHTPTTSFDLLISKNLGANRTGDSYLQWDDKYIIFEMKQGRFVALQFVSG